MKQSLFTKAVSVICSVTMAASLSGFGAGAAFAAEPTALVPGEPQSVVEAAVTWDGTADTSWYNTSSTAFTLSTPQQVAGLALITSGAAQGIARDTFSGKTVTLGADLTLNADATPHENQWKPIADINQGSDSSTSIFFDGTFDGAGHVVNNLYINGGTANYGGYQGFFGALGAHAQVIGLGIESGDVYGRVAGGIAAVSHAANAEEAPQIVGCYNKADIEGNGSTTRGAGGIFGGEDASGSMAGGSSSDAYRGAAVIADCFNFGDIDASGPSGGIAGVGSVKVYGCYNAGRVSDYSTSYVGALVGNLLAKGYKSGDFSVAGEVANSYALVGTCANLYRILDATHGKDSPAYPSDSFGDQYYNETADFLGAAEMEEYGAEYLGTAYVSDVTPPVNSRLPRLWWQAGLSTIDLAGGTIAAIPTQLYAGGALTPPLHVYIDDPNGGYEAIELNAGSDYYAVFADNVEVGTATVTVYGRGRYIGHAASTTFDIVQVDIANVTVDPIPAQWLYDKPVKPSVVVRANGEYELIEGYDYSVAYVNNDKPGQAKAVITPLRSSVVGTKEATFYVVKAASGLAGKGTADEPYLIGTKGEMQFASHMVNTDAGSYPTAHYKLTADIDARSSDPENVTDMGIDPIGVPRSGFAGTFDGDGHTVTLRMNGLELSEELGFDPYMYNLGLFALTNAANTTTIKNLTLAGSVTNYASAAAFVGSSVDAALVFENCRNDADVQATGPMMAAAGFDVIVQGGTSVSMADCENHGSVIATWEAGGLVNRLHGSKNSFNGCGNYGTVKAPNSAGGIVGEYRPSTSTTLSFENCYNRPEAGKAESGSVTSTRADGGPAGGILGFVQFGAAANNPVQFTSCYNAGAVAGGRHGGGIAGQIYTTPASFSGCYNSGAVSSNSPYVGGGGGIVGAVAYRSDGWTIKSCYNTGTVSGGTGGGAMVGHVYTGSVITLDNDYYLDSCGSGTDGMGEVVTAQGAQTPSIVTGAAEVKTAAEMAGPGVLAALGSSFVADDATDQLNGGFPLCYWQRAYAKVPVTSAKVTIEAIPDQPYASGPVEPVLVVTFADDGADPVTLQAGVDYRVRYSNNEELTGDGGAAIATVMGMGRFEGAKDMPFNIVKAAMSSCSVADIAAQWCTDMGAEPAPVVTNAAGRELVAGIDYTVSYANNTSSGTATVTIMGTGTGSGTGGYDGSIAKDFKVVKASDGLRGAGTQGDPYLIATAGDLCFMQVKVNAAAGGYPFAYYQLVGDVDLTPTDETPSVNAIGTAEVPFCGSFDGGGHAVTIGIDTTSVRQALFGVTDRAQIRNLTVDGAVNQEVAIEAGETGVAGWAAAFVAYASDSLLLENCVNNASVTTNASAAAGFVAAADASGEVVKLSNCVNNATICSTNESDGTVVAGLVGDVRAESVTVRGCANTGAVRGTSSVGGLVARALGVSSGEPTALGVSQSYNTGDVTGFYAAGGLVGTTLSHVSLSVVNSFNRGRIASNLAAGMSAYLPAASAAIGGLVGGTGSANNVVIRNVYNAGSVTSVDGGLGRGGLVGYLSADTACASLVRSYYLNDVPDGVAIQNAASVTDDGSQGASSDELKSAAMVHDLGSAFGPDEFGANGGYPIVGSQKASLPDACSISPAPDMTYSGKALKPRFLVFDRNRRALLTEGVHYEVICERNVNVGTATAHIIGTGAYEGELETSFEIVAADLSDFTADAIPSQALEGAPVEPGVTVRDAAGSPLEAGVDFTISYRGNDTVGTGYAIVRGMGNYIGYLRVPFTVLVQTSIEGKARIAPIADQPWTGAAVEPAVTVMLDGVPMVVGKEYEIEYADNLEIGAARVTVTGVGAFKGTLTTSFNIVAIDVAGASVSRLPAVTYTGKAFTPQPIVSYGGKTLALGADYTLSYQDNVNAGTASVIVKGKGHYAGKKTVTFTIRKAKASFIIVDVVATVAKASQAISSTGTAKTVQPATAGTIAKATAAKANASKARNPITFKAQTKKVSYAKVKKGSRQLTISKARNAKGKVTYRLVKASGKAGSFKIAATSGKITVKKGTKAGAYKLAVKASAAGNSAYRSGSVSRTVTVKVVK